MCISCRRRLACAFRKGGMTLNVFFFLVNIACRSRFFIIINAEDMYKASLLLFLYSGYGRKSFYTLYDVEI